MFKDLFKRKDKERVEIPENWAFYLSRIREDIASIRVNLALNKIGPIASYEQRVWFSFKLNNPDVNGLTTNEEFPIVSKIEDEISEELVKMDMISVGVIKCNGTVDLFFYAKEVKGFEEVVGKVMNKYSDYKCATDVKPDENWGDYFNFLYPDEYEYQTILNQSIISQLLEGGDNLEKEREVDHNLYFNTEENREEFIAKVERLGYKVLAKNNESNTNFSLNISKVHHVEPNTIHGLVWELILLAKETNGDYDGWGCPITQ